MVSVVLPIVAFVTQELTPHQQGYSQLQDRVAAVLPAVTGLRFTPNQRWRLTTCIAPNHAYVSAGRPRVPADGA